VAKYTAAKDALPSLMYLATPETIQIMDKLLDEISGKEATERKEQVYSQLLADGKLTVVPRESVTKTRLQFVRGTIPEEDLGEIGQAIGTDMFAVIEAGKSGSYPKDGGVRFPNAICSWCEQRGHCLKDPELVEKLL